ncbi:unnamed protein product [Ambrosiozyma monospora]|uniref:Unnamed protein product n=1 Tax=Ambrosiozyma monospora TaxID=43982 RepID=A0ACB5TAG8_AMBMO|nr:unnamed protein product [Ambrosiozyma monospora]
MVKNDLPILIVEVKLFSIADIFARDKVDSWQTQSILREISIYQLVYQMPILLSDGFDHHLIWFQRTNRMTKYPEQESQDTHKWRFSHDLETQKQQASPMPLIIDDDDDGKLGVYHCEIQFEYLKLNNLEEGFTIKKKLLAILHGETQKDPVGRKATYVDVTDETASQQGFTSNNLQEKREELARESFNFLFPTVDEFESYTKKNDYMGVDPDDQLGRF